MTPTHTEFPFRDHGQGATEKHSIIRRAKRLMVVIASTAALGATFIPMAMADTPSGTPFATAADCQSFQDTYDNYIDAAAGALAHGDLTAASAYAEDAAANKSAAEDLGCDTSTWASADATGSLPPATVNRVTVASVTVAQP